MGVLQRVTAKANASVGNLGHGFDVLGLCVDTAYDTVEVCRSDEADVIVRGAFAEGVPTDPARNTASVAVAALLSRYQLSESLTITIDKGIRPAGGMGSSAASAAGAVAAADRLLGLSCSSDQLVSFAAEGERIISGAAHADNVAASIFGGLTISDPSDASIVRPLDVPDGWQFVIVLPETQLTTAAARGVLAKEVSLADHVRGCAACSMIVSAVVADDVDAFGASIMGSLLDQWRGPLIPGREAVVRAGMDAGAAGVVISGAGPSLFAVVGSGGTADEIGEAMKAAFAEAGVRSEAMVTGVGSGTTIVETGA